MKDSKGFLMRNKGKMDLEAEGLDYIWILRRCRSMDTENMR